MQINKLQISNLRNLQQVVIEPHTELNVLYGGNGAGKTSVLESIVILSRGRSFRTTQASDLLGPLQKTFQVFAEISGNHSRTSRIGIERSGKHWRARKDGQDLSQLSQLTRALPVIVMEPNSHLLVSGAPEGRRRFLDWGMFHVEQEFLNIWSGFSKILKQRNAALRKNHTEVIDSIDDVFCELGNRLDHLRAVHCQQVEKKLKTLLSELSPGLEQVGVEYNKGWSADSLEQSLALGREKDLFKGATGSGPHRADLSFIYRGASARAVMSRGEQKVLAAALLLSQAQILDELEQAPIVLLDDLTSEFDREHFNNVLQRAMQMTGQVWISGTDAPRMEHNHKLFHVEHGGVSEVL